MPRLEPTGSVYLDAPTAPRRDVPAGQRPRRMVAGLLGFLGLALLTIGTALAGLLAVVTDPGTITGALDDSLADPEVRAQIEDEVAAGVERLFGDPVEDVWFLSIDVEAEAARIAPLVLDDPAFRQALDDLIVDLHERVLLAPNDRPIDMTPLTRAVRNVVVTELPDIEPFLPPDATVYEIDTIDLPDLSGPVDAAGRALPLSGIGIAFLVLAALAHPSWHRVLAWTGRWLLLVGLIGAALTIGLPALASQLSGQTFVEVAVRSVTVRLLMPAAAAGAAGMGMVSVAAWLRSREGARTSHEGAVAALGYEDALLPAVPSAPSDLAQRGLVDVEHPLTNV